MRNSWAAIVIALALVTALIPAIPYGYPPDALACMLGMHFAGAFFAKACRESWVWTWIVLAGVYNPVLPVPATRAIWSLVNLATLGFWFGSSQPARKPQDV